VKTAIFCICGSNNWETVVETGKLRWATYRFDPYDRHNLFTKSLIINCLTGLFCCVSWAL